MLPYSCLRGKSFFQVSPSKQTILVQSTLGVQKIELNWFLLRKEQQINKTSAFMVSDMLIVNYLSIFKYKHLAATYTTNFYGSSNGGTA